MPRINVSKVLKNPQFKENYIVHRKSGEWIAGRFVQTETNLNFSGVVVPGGTKDIIQVPEGDRTSEIMIFLSKEPIYVTRTKGTSDEIEWNGSKYRVYQVKNWSSYGYYRAIGVSMEGY